MISLTCRVYEENTNELICGAEIDSQTENKLLVSKGTGWRGRDGLSVWDWHVHTVVCVMTGQLGPPVYSTENSTQYSVVIYVGKESERMGVCTCTTESLCGTAEMITTL